MQLRGFAVRLGLGLKNKVWSHVQRGSGLNVNSVDNLATSAKLQSWKVVQIPERLKFSCLAITLVVLFPMIIAFVPWTQIDMSPVVVPAAM